MRYLSKIVDGRADEHTMDDGRFGPSQKLTLKTLSSGKLIKIYH